MFHDLEIEDIWNCSEGNEYSFKHIWIGLLNDLRRRLIDEFIQGSKSCIFERQDVIVVILVGVEFDLMWILEHDCG
jgi:hypothetical protein